MSGPGRIGSRLRPAVASIVLTLVLAGSGTAAAAGPGAGSARPVLARARVSVPDTYHPRRIGVAAFSCAEKDTVVLAAPLKVDGRAIAAALGTGPVGITSLPAATALHFRLPAGERIRVRTQADGFVLGLAAKAAAVGAISPSLRKGEVLFSDAAAGPVVSIVDPCLGGPLLVGTVLDDKGFGETLQGPGYATIPAARGVVIRADSDQLQLKARPRGFVLTAAGGAALPLGTQPISAAALESARDGPWKGYPRGSVAVLRRHLAAAMGEAAAAPPLARGQAALRVARTMLSLGMGAEAEGVLSDMLRHDPATLGDPAREQASTIAEILRRRPARALAALSDPVGAAASATPADDLWRGLALAQQGGSQRAARLIAMGVDVLGAAPAALRAALAPFAAETLATGGEVAAAKRLLAMMPDDGALGLARAEVTAAQGKTHAALAAFDRLADSRNNRVAGIAAFRAIMLRYSLHALTARKAAAALSKALYLWRGPRHELAVRLALARLQADAGDWALAMQGLRKALRRFPSTRAKIEAERQDLFDRLMASGRLKTMPPLPAVAILRNNQDLFPKGAARVPLLDIYAERLAALDLTDAARKVLAEASALRRAPAPRPERGVLATAGIGALGVAGEPADHAHTPPASTATPRVADEKSHRLDADAAKRILAEADKAVAAGDHARLQALRSKYLRQLPKGLDRALFDAATAPPLGADPKLDAALRQIAAIEKIGVELGKKSPPPSHAGGANDTAGAKAAGSSPAGTQASGS